MSTNKKESTAQSNLEKEALEYYSKTKRLSLNTFMSLFTVKEEKNETRSIKDKL